MKQQKTIKPYIKWFYKGDGGEWYEPFISNLDLIIILLITLFVGGIIIIGGLLI